MTATPYHRLEARFGRLSALAEAASVLHWDWSTGMPEGGAASRARQLAELEAVRHAMLTAPEIRDLLDGAEAQSGLDPWQRANLREMRRRWSRAVALEEDLVAALVKARADCETAWRKARPDGDVGAVLPSLTRLLALIRESAAATAEALGVEPYDALLDEHDPGRRSADIERIVERIEAVLPDLLGRALEEQRSRPAARPLDGPFPIAQQRELCKRLMERLGFDFRHGCLDESRHPFCGGTPDDVRITTRYDEADFSGSLMAVLHETGHALYERGLPRRWRGQPVGESLGMSMHEGQSLLIEMQVCRSPDFLAFAAPLMRDAFGGTGPAWEADNLYRLQTRVEPGLIRVDADEVTYPAHVILRYRLERALLAGDMRLEDLPAAWNEGMDRLFGVRPESDRDGCLQDIHWYDGAWGYFPSYLLGAMTAAQLYEAAAVAVPDIGGGIRRGDFRPLLAWLRETVHAKGCLMTGDELMVEATGRHLDTTAYEDHLKRRYLA